MSYELGFLPKGLKRAFLPGGRAPRGLPRLVSTRRPGIMRALALARGAAVPFPVVRPLALLRKTLAQRAARPTSSFASQSPEPMFADEAPVRSVPAVTPQAAFNASSASAEAAYGTPVTELEDQNQEPIEVRADVDMNPPGKPKAGFPIALVAVAAALLLFGLKKRRA